MSRRSSKRKAARSRSGRTRTHSANSPFGRSLYRRPLRLEPLEDRRLLALVTVTTLEDTVDVNDGVTSLREAIFAADIVPGADTIEFAPALTTGGPAAILLTRGELAITDSLTIDGPGASLLTIDASGNDPTPDVKNGDGSRIFNVDNGNAGMLAEVSISGLRLTGGDCEYGGAVFNYENLTISHSTIRSNTATLVGGGLASFRGSLNVFQSKISNNSSEGVGGGIFGKETEIEIVDSQLTGNTGTSGGGIFSYAGGLDVVESILNDNVANGETGTGGGIHSIGQSLHVAHSTITGNLSYRGGGIYSKQSATVIGSTIANNLAAEDGGGINAHDTLQMFATTISDNVAGGNGGGLRAANGLKFENGTVARNSAGGSGGGIWGRSEAFDAPLSVVSSTISANTSADDGAGIWLSSAHAAATIAHSTLTLNEVPTSNAGGGFFVRAGQVALDHTIVAGNLASVGSDLTGLIGAGITAKYSIIGDNADSGLSATPLNGTDSNGNRIGGSNLIDARLAPLADNGGPTQTHALMSFDGFNQSPAINAGDPAALAGVGGVPAVDQRGALFTRVFGGRIDIGAYERQTLAVSSFVVDTLYDESDGDYSAGDLSLREAIGLANGSANSFSTISFAPGLVVGGPASIRLTHGELLIRNSVTIEGPGANMLAIDASGNDPTPNVNDGSGSRVFGVDDGNNSITSFVSIRGLELTGGDVATSGGAIRNVESLSVVATKIRDNHAVENGGGIYGYSVSVADSVISGNSSLNGGGIDASLVTLSQSTIRDNFAEHNGGGIRGSVIAYLSAISENHAGNDGGGIQGSVSVHQSSIRNNYAGGDGGGIQSNGLSISTVNDSTISGNSTGPTGLGGGIHSDARSLSIVGSTISGNVASRGGGIYKFGNAISIRSSTITRNLTNSSGNGGVVFASPASSMLFSTSIASSIIAGNQGSDFEVFGNSELVQSKGYNLIGIGTAAASFDQAGDQVKLLEPLLAPLANNGGFELPDGSHIFTHALLPSCPAINAGDLNAVAGEGGVPMFDQRGEPFGRVVGGRIDIGAFEYQTPTDLNLLVDTLVDESDGDFSRGDLSLREAIELANASIFEGVVDTIRFDPALTAAGPATIRLMRMEGDGTLNIRDAVSIIGPGALLLTIDASGLDATPLKKDAAGSSAFKISGPPTLIDVSMTGLTITGGDAQTAGGAIQANLVNLTLSQMVLSNNSAGARGGAVSVIGGNLVVVGSSITGNVVRNLAGLGGGVYFQDTNPANENRLKLDHNTISGNTAPAGGGGVWASVNRGTLEFDGNEVAHNSASGAASQGGGIFASVRNVSPLFVNNNIHHNSAAHGGGMSASNIGGHAVVADSNISANTAFGFGGKGGGLLIGGDAGTVAIERTEISGNVATQPNSTGGGVYGASEMLDVSTSTIANNSAGIGGGIYSRFGGTRVVDSTISGNSAGRGGGINQSGIRGLELLRTTVAGNSATQSTGGGIHSSSREMRLADSTIRENTATGSGGGVYIVSARIANISRSNIEKNSSLESGGGVFAISRLTLVDTTVAENTALLNGGGIAHQSSGLSVVGSTISGNTASDYGGGIWARSGAQFAFSTIVENSAGSAGGGAFIYSDTLQLVNAIIAKNHASVGADVTGFLSAAIEADFSIIGNNAASGLAPAIEAPDSNGNLIGVASKIIDPMLGALADNGGPSRTHAVLSGSPAINAGDPAAVAGMNGVPVHDQRGVPFTRVFGGRIDIGAVEALPAGFLAGDYSSDGKVDAMDYSLWQDSMGMHVTPATSADGNGDGVVDGLDYAVWKSNFGVTAGDLGGSEELQGFAAAAIEPVASAVNEEPPAEPGAEVRTRIANSLVRQPPALPGVKSVQRRPVADAVTRQGRAIEAWWAARSRPVHGTRSEGFARAIRAAESCDALDYALAELGQVKLAIGN